MKLTHVSTVLLALALPLSGCVAEDDDTGGQDQLLTEFRRAVPSRAQLRAPAPEASTMNANGDPALYPTSSWGIVQGINGSVEQMIATLEAIVMVPPTVYNSATREFVWGPWPADDGVGYVAAYIKEANEDFQYHYALLRGASNDLATLTPVIWGGATPDPDDDDHGVGVTLWDFEADRAFREANDPAFDPAAGNRGRFAALWGAGPDENDAANEMAFVVAVFRDFVPEDEPANDPTDLDYFYGRYITPDHTVDFLDYEAAFDVSEPADGVAEDVGVRMAFLDEGTGRAEADAIGGSMDLNQSVAAVECWDTSINQTYIQFEVMDGGTVMDSYTEGNSVDCGLFEATLDALQIPSLQDVDPDLMAALDQVATTGAPAN
jgi:hypothetical protein